MRRSTTAIIATVVSTLLPLTWGHARAPVDTWTLVASSDRLYHGLTESTGELAVWLNAELTGKAWFGGVNLGYAPNTETIERHRPFSIYGGTEFNLTDIWQLGGTLRYRNFINSNKAWDYAELSAQLKSDKGLAVTVDYAPDYYTHDTTALVTQVSQFIQLNGQFYAVGKVGYARLGSAEDYAFGSLASGWQYGRSTVELTYQWHNLGARVRFRDRVQQPGFELTLSHRLR